jgi:hypothetical protein
MIKTFFYYPFIVTFNYMLDTLNFCYFTKHCNHYDLKALLQIDFSFIHKFNFTVMDTFPTCQNNFFCIASIDVFIEQIVVTDCLVYIYCYFLSLFHSYNIDFQIETYL